jgi:hypothetical protein
LTPVIASEDEMKSGRLMRKSLNLVPFLALAAHPLSARASWCPNVAIPAYFYPTSGTGGLWPAAVTTRTGIMIMNPASGSGPRLNDDYLSAVANIRNVNKPTKVVGYVWTNYGKRSLSSARAEIDNYKRWYCVDGIFFDEVSTDAWYVSYYTNLVTYLKSGPLASCSKVLSSIPVQWSSAVYAMLNPGINPPNDALLRMAGADNLVVFENVASNYNSWSAPSWMSGWPSQYFTHLIYNARNDAEMSSVLSLASRRNVGNIYITNDNLPNPWDTLPTYWTNEQSAITSFCTTP